MPNWDSPLLAWSRVWEGLLDFPSKASGQALQPGPTVRLRAGPVSERQEFIGDAILSVFGAPLRNPMHADVRVPILGVWVPGVEALRGANRLSFPWNG